MRPAMTHARLPAVAFVLLMLVSAFPAPAAADHFAGTLPYPHLPPVQPGSQCAETALPGYVLGGVQPTLQGNATTYFAFNGTVPLLCVQGVPFQPYQDLVRNADRILEDFRALTREAQRQADQRVETTLPKGAAFDLVRPTFPILDDSFNNSRRGGFGDWTVVTERGEAEAFRLEQVETANGTEGSWRFGDDAGYARGVHQWLVSPELDLTPVRANEAAVQALVAARDTARNQLRLSCNNAEAPPGNRVLSEFCGDDARLPFTVEGTVQDPSVRQIFEAYEAAFDDALADLPVMKEGAWLDLSYRMNLASQIDGVRVWLYGGDRAPDRVALFDPAFGLGSQTVSCANPYADGRTNAEPADTLQCSPTLRGGRVVSALPGAANTLAFREDAALSKGDPVTNRWALTGDGGETWLTARVNLSEHAGERLWLLFEVKTQGDNGRGEGFFDQPGVFARHKQYGFELGHVNATGEGWIRNFRLKDVGGEVPPVREPNGFGDNATRVGAASPGPAKVDVRVHNAGITNENGTLVVRLLQGLTGAPLAQETREVRGVKPGDVRALTFHFPNVTLTKGGLYRWNATLYPEEAKGVQLNNVLRDTNRTLDPNATAVRVNNSASFGLGGNLTAERAVRADARHVLTIARASGGTGPAFEVCSEVSRSLRCAPSYAARKGEARVLLAGVRNDGTAPEDLNVTLHVTLDGQDRGNVVLDGATRALKAVLPGETRPLTWTLNPTDPGTYTATLFVRLPDETVVAQATRFVHVQRSTGTVCFDDFTDRRECGPSFEADRPEELGGRNVTAVEADAQGRLHLLTDVRDGKSLLVERSPDGAWRVEAEIPAKNVPGRWKNESDVTDLRDALYAPDGKLYLVGSNRTVLSLAPGGAASNVLVNHTLSDVNLTTAAWWNGTLYAAGRNGVLLRMNGSVMERVPLTTSTCAGDQMANATFTGDLHALHVFGTRLYAGGAGGHLFTSVPGFPWEFASSEDRAGSPRRVGAGPFTCPGHELGAGRSVRAFATQGATLLAFGDDGLVLRALTARSFATAADVPTTDFDARVAFTAHTGDLYVLAADGAMGTCAACADERDGLWTFPELPVPSIPVGKDYARARLAAAARTNGTTTLAGQGGVVLDLARRDAHHNEEDWTVVNPLVAHDGAVLQTKARASANTPTAAEGLRLELNDTGREAANQATEFRVSLRHFVKHATTGDSGGGVEVRALFEDYPNFRPGGKADAANSVQLCPRDRFTGQSPDAENVDLGTVCHREELLRTLLRADRPTQSDRWEKATFTVTAPSLAPPGAAGRQTRFAGIELYREKPGSDGKDVLWAVDDVLVEMRLGGAWVPLMSWYGPLDVLNTRPAPASVVAEAPFERLNETARETNQTLGESAPLAGNTAADVESNVVSGSEWEMTPEVFGIEPRSAWHLTTTLAERPVFALNDEWLRDGLSTVAEPHLRSGWNARLVSPVLNLSDADDPLVSFRHLYAFRTYSAESGGTTYYQHGDTGRVEVQWLKEGPEECPGVAPGQTCGWSAFVPLRPEGGYPNAAANGYGSATPFPVTVPNADLRHEEHDAWGVDAQKPLGEGRSFWGRSMEPNDRNVFVDARDLANYQEARIRLKDHECGPFPKAGCLPTLAGRKIRIAFHAITAPENGKYNHTSADQVSARTSFGGEGWYVTDFKVLGAPRLGIDLGVTDLTFPVGFEWARIGVGPGTKVPVNFTVANRGAFEAFGYTAELVVRRVVDAADKRADVVARLGLPQQPEIDPGADVTHTLVWSVPEGEGEEYVLEVRVAPIGIAEDEDVTDNLARLGSFVTPVVARTVREHRVELLVTPENATTDITRYVPIYVHNTGNVPEERLTLTREITLLQGPASRLVDRRTFETGRPVPQGTRVSLASVADLDATEDLFWKAPERANFLFTLGSLAPDGRRAGDEKLVSAFATFLFDDVEGGARGEGVRGDWTYGEGWAREESGGFRSPKSVAFGDVDAQKHDASADASLVTPLVDLSGARSARVAFYHRYSLEPGFDAGVLEASADGGKTWTTLGPLPDPLNKLDQGYSGALSAASPLHPDGDPGHVAMGFTGDSAQLPGAVDGWTLSQFDLTEFGAITERDVAYESYTSDRLQGYQGLGSNTVLQPGRRGNATYTEKTWMVGPEEDARYWSHENLQQESVRSVAGNSTFWWSGSASLGDDGVRPLGNHLLNVTVNLTTARTGLRADDGKTVTLEWWEWSERYGEHLQHHENKGGATETALKDLRSVAAFFLGSAGQTWRYNVTEPVLLEKQGKWLRFSSDLSAFKGQVVHVQFVYAPARKAPDATKSLASEEKDDGRYVEAFLEDRGFAIDGLRAYAGRVVNGVTIQEPILDEEDAWASATQWDCDRPTNGASLTHRTEFRQEHFPCFSSAKKPHAAKPILNRDTCVRPGFPVGCTLGRSWSLVETLPKVNATWGVVPVRDAEGHDATDPLPTGAIPSAWWTGDARCVVGGPCQAPGAETRLVTPAVDLGRIAGQSAILTFDHRYAFHTALATRAKHPFASGGVVEIQVYDPQAGTWGAWEQLYARPDAMRLPAGVFDATKARDGVTEGVFGGYSGYTVNDSMTLDGKRKRHDPPFEPVPDAKLRQDVQFLYTGNSTHLSGTPDGWLDARYDVSHYIGKKVRFGFHASFSTVSSQGTNGHRGATIVDPDGSGKPRGGWWIADVEVVGTILRADPVLLRLRAATDANVDEGFWQVDDLGVFGARYSRAVGVFADEGRAYGAVLNQSVTIPLTLRNMGDSVRRDLAIEVRLDPPQRVNFTTDAPGGGKLDGETFRMMGFTLGPGRAAQVNLTIRAPAEASADLVRSTLLVDLKELNPSFSGAQGDPYEAIADNEVQGILHRDLVYETAKLADVAFTGFHASPAVGEVGQPVLLDVTAKNVGHVATRVALACTAETLERWEKVDHARPDGRDEAIVKATADCDEAAGDTLLSPGETSLLTFRAVPQADGMLRFTLRGSLQAGAATRNLTAPLVALAPVGRSPVAYATDFTDRSAVDAWKGAGLGSQADWSPTRGHRGAGALLLGLSDEAAAGTGHDYSGQAGRALGANRSAYSPAIDLHNYTTETAYLTFWHQDRFARWDGGQVLAQARVTEGGDPTLGWTQPCLLRPVGGYEGFLLSFVHNSTETTPDDVNPGAFSPAYGTGVVPPEHLRRDDWFVSDGPNGGTPEDGWTRAVFNLSDQPACPKLQGRVVRFELRTSLGSPFGTLDRGLGQGWLLDDLSVGPLNLELRPGSQKGVLLDNTTKDFSLLVRNLGSFPDVVRLALDEANSSTPAGSVRLPTEPITLAAGETRRVLVNVTLPRDPSLLPTGFKARVTAQSQLDPNAVASTVADLLFAPRPWAELSVTAQAPPDGGFAGTETFVPILVENNGLVESVATTLRVTDRWAGGERVTVLDLPPMPSFFQSGDEATRTLEYRWKPVEGSLGEHTLLIEVDPEGRGQEYTRENNVLVLTVPVGELPLPDLDVSAERALGLRNAFGAAVSGAKDADVTRYEVTAGELVTFELKVHNRGRAGATNVNVRAALGSLNLPSKTIPYVAPGAEVAVTFNWLAQKGDYALEFQVLTEQFELGTANNRQPARGVVLLLVKGFEVDVGLGAPPALVQPGTSHRVAFNLTNPGNAGEDLILQPVTPNGLRVELPKTALFLRAGETYRNVAVVHVDDVAVAGPQLISIEAIARDNPMKAAAASATVNVEAFYGGSVAPTRVESAPPLLVVPVRLENEGNSLSPWTVSVQLPAGWSARETLPAKLSVPPRGAATLELHVSVPAATAPGPRVLEINATMPNGEKRAGQVTVDVRPLRSAQVALADAEPKPANGTLSFPLTVENRGNVKQPFEMILVGVPRGVQAKVEPATFDLAPGGKAAATLTLVPSPEVKNGVYPITGYALFDGVHPDTAEGRSNAQTLRVDLRRPDLELGTVDAVPRVGAKVGDRVAVKVPVLNAGPALVRDVPIHLYVDDVFIAQAMLPAVQPDGGRAEAILNWTALPGQHTLTVVVDPYNETLDADRADNAASLLLDVGAAGVAGGVAAGRVPGPGAFLVVLALVGAALFAIPSRRSRRPPK